MLLITKLLSSPNAIFIYEALRCTVQLTKSVNDGFATFTWNNALPVLRSGTGAGHNPLGALFLNCGGTFQHLNTGTRTIGNIVAVNFGSSINTRFSNAQTLNVTNMTGLSVNPTWNTNPGTTISFGTLRGLWARSPTVAPFGGSSAGLELLTAYYAVDMDAVSFGGNVPKACVRSSLAPASNAHFLLNTGGAQSDFGGGNLLDCGIVQVLADNIGWSLGAAGGDVQGYWDSVGYVLDPLVGDNIRQQFGTDFHILESLGTSPELRLGYDRFHVGGIGSVGNQFFLLAQPALSTTAAGEFAGVLLTQAGNLTYDHAMTALYAWVINALSLTAGAGSFNGPIATLNIGGMTTSGIGSNPTAALRSTGRFWQRGVIRFEPISPAQITANQDDYQPQGIGNAMRGWARLDSDAAYNITGIVAGDDGDTLRLTNIGSFTLTLTNQDGASASANQFLFSTGGNIALAADASIDLIYDNTTGAWRDA